MAMRCTVGIATFRPLVEAIYLLTWHTTPPFWQGFSDHDLPVLELTNQKVPETYFINKPNHIKNDAIISYSH